MITPHFPPDGSAASHRVRLLAPYLPENGWEPVVLSVAPSAYEGSLDPDLLSLVPPSLRVIRAPAWNAASTRRIGLGDLGLRAFTGLRRAARQAMAVEKFDALFVTIYPTYPALLGPGLKRRFGVPFVLDYQDPWVGSWGLTVGGGPNGAPDLKSRVSRRIAACLEPIAVRAADAITAVSSGTYEAVLARVRVEPPPVVAALPLGWDASDLAAVEHTPPAAFDPRDGAVHLSYVGTLLPNGIDVLRSLLGAVRLLRDRCPSTCASVRLHFIGTSNQYASSAPCRVLPLAADYGLADIVTEHAPRVPYLEALRILKHSTAVLLLGSSEPHYTASKLYPALMAGRPMLAVFHEASSVTTILRSATRPPTVRIVAYGNAAPAAEEVFVPLRDLVASPHVEVGGIDMNAAAPVSARAVAAGLARVLDRVS